MSTGVDVLPDFKKDTIPHWYIADRNLQYTTRWNYRQYKFEKQEKRLVTASIWTVLLDSSCR